ncbi:MAG: aldo/keto reductase [Defluviitaleaceae bacterium]|nr:aldo/keto reductase [Defluviitaleaceae bacterium]
MLYTNFGNTGIQISRLGFGAMRLPMKEIEGKRFVDEDLAIPLMRRAFDLGVNYVDSAPYYCDSQSEIAVGKAVKGYEGKVYVSTKNPLEDDTQDGFTARLERSLKNLDRDFIDFYHLWGIDLESFTKFSKPGGPIESAQKALGQGMIKRLSFSYHGKPEDVKTVVDSGLFSSMLIQYNLLDRSNEAGIAYAHEHGLGVVVMGPVGGGRLGAPSPALAALLKEKSHSSAETALRFVLSNPNVNVALSGMGNLDMVEENVRIACNDNLLTETEKDNVNEMMRENRRLAELYCTGCRYCMDCPQGIDIPRLFELMNYHKVYGQTEYAGNIYTHIVNGTGWDKSKPATACVECGACEAKCPQKIEIIRQLKETHEALYRG